MPPRTGDGWDAPLLEGVLWGLLLVWAAVRTWRTPRAERPTWWLITGGLLLIVVDKAFDVHAVAHAFGTWIASTVDPEHQLRGPHAVHRNVVLVLGLLVACGLVGWWVRRDARVGHDKRWCIAGLVIVGVLLAARLMPQLEELLADWITKGVELSAWLLVLLGLWRGGGPARRSRTAIVDGFV